MSLSSRTLLLFDVDGVLIHPVGYKEATRATVARFAALMGLSGIEPTDDDIAVFEAGGITNEWDSAPICCSAILLAALAQRPDLCGSTLAETLSAIQSAGLTISRPAFSDLAREVARLHINGRAPSALYLADLANRLDPALLPLVSALLEDVYSLDTLTTRVFQTYTLGSDRFAQTYGFDAPFTSESYLGQYDLSLISETNRDHLLDWLTQPGHGATIFTARPSLPPAGVPVLGYPPEGELAAELLGLAGRLPLMGKGRVDWLAEQHGRSVLDYIKPAPVQALAAIGAAAADQPPAETEIPALEAAIDLYEHGNLSGPLAEVSGQSVRVVLFEDSSTGINAARRAAELLRDAGLNITFEAVGISTHVDKQAALSAIADRIVNGINDGLAPILNA